MRCAACSLPIRRGERYTFAGDYLGAVHVTCPGIHTATDADRPDAVPELTITLRPGPPEAS